MAQPTATAAQAAAYRFDVRPVLPARIAFTGPYWNWAKCVALSPDRDGAAGLAGVLDGLRGPGRALKVQANLHMSLYRGRKCPEPGWVAQFHRARTAAAANGGRFGSVKVLGIAMKVFGTEYTDSRMLVAA